MILFFCFVFIRRAYRIYNHSLFISCAIIVLRSHIHEYGWNGHRMLITIEHMNLEIRKHVTTSCSDTKPFYQLWVKGLDVRRRDTIFYAVFFIWPPTRAAPIGRTFASRLRTPKVDPSRLASSTRLWLFKFSHKPPRASGAWRHPHPVTAFRLGLLWHLSDTSIRPRAPALTPASMLHLTNPCAEPKGSKPN